MNDQLVLLFFIAIAGIATTWLSVFKARKQIEYRGDERWNLIQLKANHIGFDDAQQELKRVVNAE